MATNQTNSVIDYIRKICTSPTKNLHTLWCIHVHTLMFTHTRQIFEGNYSMAAVILISSTGGINIHIMTMWLHVIWLVSSNHACTVVSGTGPPINDGSYLGQPKVLFRKLRTSASTSSTRSPDKSNARGGPQPKLFQTLYRWKWCLNLFCTCTTST
jgi:hypothetical protein